MGYHYHPNQQQQLQLQPPPAFDTSGSWASKSWSNLNSASAPLPLQPLPHRQPLRFTSSTGRSAEGIQSFDVSYDEQQWASALDVNGHGHVGGDESPYEPQQMPHPDKSNSYSDIFGCFPALSLGDGQPRIRFPFLWICFVYRFTFTTASTAAISPSRWHSTAATYRWLLCPGICQWFVIGIGIFSKMMASHFRHHDGPEWPGCGPVW
jgi:hypothetical protein